MGRKKMKMELIQNKNSRSICFKKRRDNVIKKAEELSILCDVAACVVIYGPNEDAVVWPPDPHRVMGLYKSHIKAGKSCKSFGVSDFLNDKIKKADQDVMKLRKAKYPCPTALLESVKVPLLLRSFADGLKEKIEVAKARIDFLKKQEFNIRNHNQENDYNNQENDQFYDAIRNHNQENDYNDQELYQFYDAMLAQNTLPLPCVDGFLPAPQAFPTPEPAFPMIDMDLFASLNDGEAFPESFPMMNLDEDEFSQLLASLS